MKWNDMSAMKRLQENCSPLEGQVTKAFCKLELQGRNGSLDESLANCRFGAVLSAGKLE